MQKLSEFGWGSDAYPGEEPQAVEDRAQADWVDHDPEPNDGTAEYNWFYGNGQLHVAPRDHFSHDDLRGHAAVPQDSTGPIATGTVAVDHGRATWSADGNISLRSLHKVLSDYTKHVGWRWHGLTGVDGDPVDDDFAPKKSMWLRDNETGRDHEWFLQGKTAHVENLTAEQREVIANAGYRLAEYPGGGTFEDRIHWNDPGGETLETYDRGSMRGGPTDLADRDQPPGTFKCHQCGEMFPNWGQYITHGCMSMPKDEPVDDGKFPEAPNMDLTLPPRFHDRQPHVMPLASIREAERYGEWDEFTPVGARTRLYGAYYRGELRGVVSVDSRPAEPARVVFAHARTDRDLAAILTRVRTHYPAVDASPDDVPARVATGQGMVRVASGTYRWAAGQDPKDMIASPIPFIFDVDADTIALGHPGERHSDVMNPNGQPFTPGGIVEGTYEPGGKVLLQNRTTIPYTTRHLGDLWEHILPHMEITSIERIDDQGNTQKLASVRTSAEVGSYVKTIAATDPAVWRAYQALADEGGHVYAVGGVVRDALMQKEPKDVDLMVTGLPSEVVNHVLSKLPGKMDLTGKSFGVYRYNYKGHEVEIALPRTETSTGDTRRDFDVRVDHNLPVEDDLLRRDFTINSMAVDLDSGHLVDPFGGAKDIAENRLKTTHPSSFVEDPTRILRALVMHGRYGFVPDEQTRHEMTKHADRLDRESWDNMNGIMEKIMESADPARAMRLAQETGVMKHIIPELHTHFDFDQNNAHHKYTLGDHSLQVLANLAMVTKDPDLRMAGLLHDLGKPESAWVNPETGFNHYYRGPEGQGNDHEIVGAQIAANRLAAIKWGSKARQNRIVHIITHHMWPAFSSPKGARKFIHRVGDEHADDLLTFRWADQRGKGQTPEELEARTHIDKQRALVEQVRSVQAPTSQAALAINGNDVQALGVPPGPAIGAILRHLTDEVVNDPALNTPEALRELAQEYIRAMP